MPVGSIPAITGKLRKRLILDLTVALGGGTALGYGYWCVLALLFYQSQGFDRFPPMLLLC